MGWRNVRPLSLPPVFSKNRLCHTLLSVPRLSATIYIKCLRRSVTATSTGETVREMSTSPASSTPLRTAPVLMFVSLLTFRMEKVDRRVLKGTEVHTFNRNLEKQIEIGNADGRSHQRRIGRSGGFSTPLLLIEVTPRSKVQYSGDIIDHLHSLLQRCPCIRSIIDAAEEAPFVFVLLSTH